MIDTLAAEDFEPAIGDAFVLSTDDGNGVVLTLVQARLHDPDAPARSETGGRAPFSLVFRGPADPLLPQRIYRLAHDSLGSLDIFIVPIAQDSEGTSYEAVFS